MDFGHFRNVVARYGLHNGLFHVSYRAGYRIAKMLVARAVHLTMDALDPGYLEGAQEYETRFLAPDEIRRFAAADPKALPPGWVEEALVRGDECYGVIDGENLAAFGWYANRPTPLDDQLLMHFGNRYYFMHRGFTAPAYRGQRLHGIGMARALRTLHERGCGELVSHVEVNNFASLRSCERMGYVQIGHLAAASVGGHWFVYASRGCRQFGMWLEPRVRPALGSGPAFP